MLKERHRGKPSAAGSNRPRGGENPLTTGVKQAVPYQLPTTNYQTGREAWYLLVSTTEQNQKKKGGRGEEKKPRQPPLLLGFEKEER